ncbi:hypothetical protein ACHAWF_004701 [Thalassiosira exigua]
MSSDDSSSSSPSLSVLYDVLGSAVAGIISRIFTHPLDTAKARLQASSTIAGGLTNTTFRGPVDALIRTYRHEGIRSLYGGFGAVIVGGTPGTVVYLTGYAFFRDSISSALMQMPGRGYATTTSGAEPSLSQGEEFIVHFSSGMLAETVTCIVYVPVDVVKERMQVQRNLTSQGISRSYQYNGSWDALQQIIRTEGLRGIYKGYGATLASFGPFSALYFMFYERCKLWSREYIQRQREVSESTKTSDTNKVNDGDLPLLHLVACSAGAGALASWLTSPLDMAKLRLQVQRGQTAAAGSLAAESNPNHAVQYRGMADCLSAAYKEGGVRGLFRGAGARVIHFAPATTITMTLYEKCRSFFAETLG